MGNAAEFSYLQKRKAQVIEVLTIKSKTGEIKGDLFARRILLERNSELE